MSMDEHYTEGTWKGHTVYACDHCRFKSMDYEALIIHVERQHLPQMRVRPAEGGLVTKQGKEMHVVEEHAPPQPIRGDSSHEVAETIDPTTDAEEKPKGYKLFGR